MESSFSVFSKHKGMKFSAAHFIAHEKEREYLHGHEYRVTIQGFCKEIRLSFILK